MTYFAQNLKRLRKNSGLLQNELSDNISVSRQAISNYEQGKRECAFSVLIEISEYFGVTIDELLKLPIS